MTPESRHKATKVLVLALLGLLAALAPFWPNQHELFPSQTAPFHIVVFWLIVTPILVLPFGLLLCRIHRTTWYKPGWSRPLWPVGSETWRFTGWLFLVTGAGSALGCGVLRRFYTEGFLSFYMGLWLVIAIRLGSFFLQASERRREQEAPLPQDVREP